MNCSEVRYSLPEFVEGRLSEAAASGIRGHLKTCADCGREVAGLEELVQRLRARSEAQPPEHYWITLLPRIHQRIEERRTPPGAVVPRWVYRYALPSAVAAAIIVVVLRMAGPGPGEGASAGWDSGLQAVVEQMDESEMREVVDVYALNPFAADMGRVNGEDRFSADPEVLKELLGTSAGAQWETEGETALPEKLSDQQVDELLSQLGRKKFIQ